jgi:two-component system chemotaxis response regulator CheY
MAIDTSTHDLIASGADALSTLRDGRFGPGSASGLLRRRVTGLRLLRAVRADERLKSLPFIMITADSNAENVAAAMIVKPFTAEMLSHTTEQTLGRA